MREKEYISNQEVREALRKHEGKKNKAAKELGLTTSQLSAIEKRDSFKEAKKEAEEKTLDFMESRLLHFANKEGVVGLKATTYYLDRKGRKRGYGQSLEVNQTERKKLLINIEQTSEEEAKKLLSSDMEGEGW